MISLNLNSFSSRQSSPTIPPTLCSGLLLFLARYKQWEIQLGSCENSPLASLLYSNDPGQVPIQSISSLTRNHSFVGSLRKVWDRRVAHMTLITGAVERGMGGMLYGVLEGVASLSRHWSSGALSSVSGMSSSWARNLHRLEYSLGIGVSEGEEGHSEAHWTIGETAMLAMAKHPPTSEEIAIRQLLEPYTKAKETSNYVSLGKNVARFQVWFL